MCKTTYFCTHGFIKAIVFTANFRVFARDLKYTIGGINPIMTKWIWWQHKLHNINNNIWQTKLSQPAGRRHNNLCGSNILMKSKRLLFCVVVSLVGVCVEKSKKNDLFWICVGSEKRHVIIIVHILNTIPADQIYSANIGNDKECWSPCWVVLRLLLTRCWAPYWCRPRWLVPPMLWGKCGCAVGSPRYSEDPLTDCLHMLISRADVFCTNFALALTGTWVLSHSRHKLWKHGLSATGSCWVGVRHSADLLSTWTWACYCWVSFCVPWSELMTKWRNMDSANL
jgi:hypothetical protein